MEESNEGTDHLVFCCKEDFPRADKFLRGVMNGYSRSYIQKLIKNHLVTLEGKAIKASDPVRVGDRFFVRLPKMEIPDILPEEIPLDIFYEDDDLLIVNKPKGMVVHPAPGHERGTLVNALLAHCKGHLSGINGVGRPGIVHRIDKDTTGLIVVCKSDRAYLGLAAQLKAHDMTRKYQAIVVGTIKENSGQVDLPIGRSLSDRKKMSVHSARGRRAVTDFKVLERFAGYTYIECTLKTGRTHQIRVHMASIGHPVLGDKVYGPKKCPFDLIGQTLHAKTLGFTHPVTGRYLEFDSPLPKYFEDLLNKLREKS